MNSAPFINRVKILLYSTLISVMSGISSLKAKVQDLSFRPPEQQDEGQDILRADEHRSPGRAASLSWQSIQQTLLALLLWIILGFAAGFLLGMIRPR